MLGGVILRRSARISKLDWKMNEYIRGKMDTQDMTLDDITWNNLFGMVMLREWTHRDYQKLWLTGNLKEGKKQGHPWRTWKYGIYTAMNERDKNGRMEQSKAMEYESRKASSDILKPRDIYMGESNGNLPLRICPGCSVPEPYRSPDWVLVPAKTGLKAEY